MEHVYFIRCGGRNGPVKVGRARDPRERLSTLQVGNPVELTLVHAEPTDDPVRLEARVHRMLADDAIRGEWFRHSSKVTGIIAAMKRGEFAAAQARPGVPLAESGLDSYVEMLERDGAETLAAAFRAPGFALTNQSAQVTREA